MAEGERHLSGPALSKALFGNQNFAAVLQYLGRSSGIASLRDAVLATGLQPPLVKSAFDRLVTAGILRRMPATGALKQYAVDDEGLRALLEVASWIDSRTKDTVSAEIHDLLAAAGDLADTEVDVLKRLSQAQPQSDRIAWIQRAIDDLRSQNALLRSRPARA